MAPAIWRRQLAAGAWGLTVANAHQLKVAWAFGVPRVQVANALVGKVGLDLAQSMVAAGTRVVVWADSAATARLVQSQLDPQGPPLEVLVELGAAGGRTGARTPRAALEAARTIQAAPGLRLAGVAGYEGALSHGRGPEDLQRLTDYLDALLDLHRHFSQGGFYQSDQVILTAGGSAYPDLVARQLAPALQLTAKPRTTVLLRCGAYVIHDDGFYRGISPLAQPSPDRPSAAGPGAAPTAPDDPGSPGRLRSAMHGWAAVISRPEPGLALLDGGKRDFSFDEGLPEPQWAMASGRRRGLGQATVTAMNDQHTFLRLPPGDPLAVGDTVRLGLSHPCTALDKWRLVPVVSSADAPNPQVTELVATFF
jgi:D-serine deaminase-like pyridoxal phosphate-dependent protein